MTQEEITDIIVNRMDAQLNKIKEAKTFSVEWRQIVARIDELTTLLEQIRKENEAL